MAAQRLPKLSSERKGVEGMDLARRSTMWVAGLAIGAVLLSACASKTAATTKSGGGSTSSGSTSSGTPTVRAQNVANMGMVLVDSRGFTLYYMKGESASSIQCTGSCASAWPPLLIASGTQPTAGPGVSGNLGTVKRPDSGTQVTFDGMPLYTFQGDSGPGQATGQGVSNFFVATATGAAVSSGSTSSGYSYGS
jgi:predicted lipoprotein with Yx(FWY)xxD motif